MKSALYYGQGTPQLAALWIVEKSKETGQSAHYVYVKTEPVTNPSNPSAARTKGTRHEPVKPVTGKSGKIDSTTQVTPENKRFIQEKREKSKPLAGTKMARRGTVTSQVGVQSRLESRLESKLAARIFSGLSKGALGKKGIALLLGHKTVSGELHKQVKRMIDAELLEMTLPDKPNSRLQKYRLTAKGQTYLASFRKEEVHRPSRI